MDPSITSPHAEPGTPPPGEPMIQLRRLEKCCRTRAGFSYILRQINLDVAAGEFITVMGPSGAGKSTLLSILGMYDPTWEGEFFFHDHPVHRLKPRDRAALNKKFIGFVFQQFHLLEDLTVAENLDIPLGYRNIPKPERQAMVADLLDRFSMVAKKDLYPAASNNSWPSPAPSSPSPPCCWRMNRPATSIPIRAARSWSCSRS